MTSYIENINKIIKDGDEVKFNERLKWIEDNVKDVRGVY